MKCFHHQDHDAVGICKNCAKGVCSNCAVDIGDGLACQNSCEEKAKAVVNMIQSSLGVQRDFKKRGVYMFPAFSVSLGLVFMISSIITGNVKYFLLLSGAIFFVFGIAVWFLNRKHAKRID